MKPEPIWQRAMKDPKKREKVFRFYFYLMIFVHLTLVAGFIFFIFFLAKRT